MGLDWVYAFVVVVQGIEEPACADGELGGSWVWCWLGGRGGTQMAQGERAGGEADSPVERHDRSRWEGRSEPGCKLRLSLLPHATREC